jgi:heme exporter protein B
VRERSESALVVLFFVLGAILFPFGVGPEPNMLARIAAGIVWVMALFAAMLSLERLFQADYEDGSLELLALTPLPLGDGSAKAAHRLTTALPLMSPRRSSPSCCAFRPTGCHAGARDAARYAAISPGTGRR